MIDAIRDFTEMVSRAGENVAETWKRVKEEEQDLSDVEIIERCALKLGEFFEHGINPDTTNFADLSVAWDVAEIIDWYKEKIGVQSHLEAAGALFEVMKTGEFAGVDKADFLKFIEDGMSVVDRYNYRLDGSVPDFIKEDKAESLGSVNYHRIPIM